MGIADIAARAGKRVIRETGHIAGAEAIKGWGRLVKTSAQSIRHNVMIQSTPATRDEFACIKSEFYDHLNELTDDEYNQHCQNWRIRSRWHYVGALILLIVAGYFLVVDPGWTGMNALGLAALNFAQGLRASYRHWQMRTRTFFVEGAFKEWLAQGHWLV